MKYFARHKKKCLVVLCNLIVASVLISFSGCIAGADYENKMIYVYRSTGPRVLEQFKVTRSKKEIPTRQATETPDEILFRIIDTEIKRSGQVVYASRFNSIIHAEADKLKKLFPELRIAVVHKPFSEWTRSWHAGTFRYPVSLHDGTLRFKGGNTVEDMLRVTHLDENCCPEEYKTMKKEDFDEIVSDFFAGQYDILLCIRNYYNKNNLSKRDSPIGKPALIEKSTIRIKSGVKRKKWKLMDGIWRARCRNPGYQWVEPADPIAVQIIENLYGEK